MLPRERSNADTWAIYVGRHAPSHGVSFKASLWWFWLVLAISSSSICVKISWCTFCSQGNKLWLFLTHVLFTGPSTNTCPPPTLHTPQSVPTWSTQNPSQGNIGQFFLPLSFTRSSVHLSSPSPEGWRRNSSHQEVIRQQGSSKLAQPYQFLPHLA